jgi:hypothetical protein
MRPLPCLRRPFLVLSSSAAHSASNARPGWRGGCWAAREIGFVQSVLGIRIVGIAALAMVAQQSAPQIPFDWVPNLLKLTKFLLNALERPAIFQI